MTDKKKTCRDCKQDLPATFEFFSKFRKNGREYFVSNCRSCMRARYRDYYSRNRPKLIARATESTRKRRERPEVQEKERVYCRDRMREKLKDPSFREQHKQRWRSWWEQNSADPEWRDKLNARQRRNRQKRLAEDPNYRGVLAHHSNMRVAREKGAKGVHTFADVQRQRSTQGGLCFYCPADLNETGYHIDHYVPLARGGSNGPENIRLACPSCNMTKRDMMPDDFRALLQRRASRAARATA